MITFFYKYSVFFYLRKDKSCGRLVPYIFLQKDGITYMKKLISLFSVLVCCAGLFASSFEKGATAYVSEKAAKVKASTGLFAKTVATAEYGDVVTVLKSESKKTQVKIGNTTGWIANSALTTKKIVKANGSAVLASTEELALAAKGNIKATADATGEQIKAIGEESEKAAEDVKNAAVDAAEKVKDAAKELKNVVLDPK